VNATRASGAAAPFPLGFLGFRFVLEGDFQQDFFRPLVDHMNSPFTVVASLGPPLVRIHSLPPTVAAVSPFERSGDQLALQRGCNGRRFTIAPLSIRQRQR
jgi:hypothetical protein